LAGGTKKRRRLPEEGKRRGDCVPPGAPAAAAMAPAGCCLARCRLAAAQHISIAERCFLPPLQHSAGAPGCAWRLAARTLVEECLFAEA